MKNAALFLLVFVLCSCIDTPRRTKTYYLMYVDLSGSMSQNDIENVASDAKKTVQRLLYPCHLEVRLIDENTSQKSLLETVMNDEYNNGIKAIYEDYERAMLADYLKDTILAYAKGVRDGSVADVQRSCVISTLRPAYEWFSDLPKDTLSEKVLIYCSDMYEQCGDSRANSGVNDLCEKGIVSSSFDTSGVFMNLEEGYKPDFNLKRLIGNSVYIIQSSSMLEREEGKYCLSETELREFWSRVFQKVGYSKDDYDAFHFNQSMPDSILPK